MKGTYDSVEDLRVWKEAMKLCIDVHIAFRYSRNFPLRDQAMKSAISIPSDIAEGFERHSNKEFIHFLYVAKASAAELRTQLQVAKSIGELVDDVGTRLIETAKKVSSMLSKFIKAREGFNE